MSNSENRPTIICLTPVKNEAWILDRFLQCASLWADYIIIADQGSDDGSREIAKSYNKVILVDNPSPTFNEPERQKILIEAARKIPQPRLFITLDADEFLTANCLTSSEWNTVLQAPAGTVIKFQIAELQPDISSYWLGGNGYFPWGFMDDGSEHQGKKIHSPRIPLPDNSVSIMLRDIKVLHYQCANQQRMKSKHRWYQCWEKLNQPQKTYIDIFRQYHSREFVASEKIQPLPSDWLLGYTKKGIDMTSICSKSPTWWDREIITLFKKYGTEMFKQLDIWDVDWLLLAEQNSLDIGNEYYDPRSKLDKIINKWLRKTQLQQNKLHIRAMEKLLKLIK